MSGSTLPATMAPSPTIAAASTRNFICQVSSRVLFSWVIKVHLISNSVQHILAAVHLSRSAFKELAWNSGNGLPPTHEQWQHPA